MLPTLTRRSGTRKVTTVFRGLNLSRGIGDGEWAWTENACTREIPAMARRRARVRVAALEKPNGLCALDKLCFVDGKKFYYNGYYYGEVADSEKTLVPMGAKIAVFPDKLLFDTETCRFEAMEQTNTAAGGVTVTLAKGDGTDFGAYTAADTAPEDPENGAWWLDTGASPPVMKQWSEAQSQWVEEATTYVKVAADGIGAGLAAQDGVTVRGLVQSDLNGDWILSAAEEDAVVFTGILTAEITQTEAVTVARTCPDMDFVIERDNRLWGCSGAAHEIYCCRLGDPKNWRAYEGISTDAYAVTVGTPGPFTGAAVSGSAAVFFKENCLHKVYGTQPGNFQVVVENVRGVQQGCGKSTVRVNEYLYYKSPFDLCVYADSEVAGISAALGTERYEEAVCGVCGSRLVVSAKDSAGAWHLLVYDTEKGLWMREDNAHAVGFASCLTETFMLTADGTLYALLSGAYSKDFFMVGSDYTVTAEEEADADIPWELRTGEMARELPDHKYIGKIQLLLELWEGAAAEVSVRRDAESWETAAELRAAGTQRVTCPIYPRRCDRLTLRLKGTGDIRLIGMSKTITNGSEY